MRRFLVALMATALIAGEAQAADWRIQGSEMQTGTFVGARLKLSLGDRADAKPHAQLTIAPTRSSISTTGFIRTRIGEGVALDLQPSRKPVLTIAGMRADTALGLQRGRGNTPEQKLGISTGAAVAIGVGVVAIAGAAYFLYLVNEADKATD